MLFTTRPGMSGLLPFLAFLPLIDPMADEDWNRPILALRNENVSPKANIIIK